MLVKGDVYNLKSLMDVSASTPKAGGRMASQGAGRYQVAVALLLCGRKVFRDLGRQPETKGLFEVWQQPGKVCF